MDASTPPVKLRSGFLCVSRRSYILVNPGQPQYCGYSQKLMADLFLEDGAYPRNSYLCNTQGILELHPPWLRRKV